MKNLVTAVERDTRGMVLRLSVGIADLEQRVWLAKPVPLSAYSVARAVALAIVPGIDLSRDAVELRA